MKKKKINPQEFDCGCCGNQIYKSRLRDEVSVVIAVISIM